MASKSNAAVAAPVAPAAKPAPVVMYTVVAPKRALITTTTLQLSNAGTHAALAAQANGKPISGPAALAVCVGRGHKGFYAYAVRNHWLLPVA